MIYFLRTQSNVKFLLTHFLSFSLAFTWSSKPLRMMMDVLSPTLNYFCFDKSYSWIIKVSVENWKFLSFKVYCWEQDFFLSILTDKRIKTTFKCKILQEFENLFPDAGEKSRDSQIPVKISLSIESCSNNCFPLTLS